MTPYVAFASPHHAKHPICHPRQASRVYTTSREISGCRIR